MQQSVEENNNDDTFPNNNIPENNVSKIVIYQWNVWHAIKELGEGGMLTY